MFYSLLAVTAFLLVQTTHGAALTTALLCADDGAFSGMGELTFVLAKMTNKVNISSPSRCRRWRDGDTTSEGGGEGDGGEEDSDDSGEWSGDDDDDDDDVDDSEDDDRPKKKVKK